LATKTIRGVELVEEVARLATMNLLLHGVAGNADDELPVACEDSLREPPQNQVDVVLTNPPFGVKGSVTYAQDRRPGRGDDSLTIIRPDFWVQTANKQLNFLQHIVALLKPGGRAAVVVPDNVLFETGAAAAIRRRLLESCRVHTLLRLPPGLFYAQGVKSNVLFFDRVPASARRSKSGSLWAYDLRSDKRFTLKTKPLQRQDLDEFVTLYRARSAHRGDDHSWLGTNARSRAFDVQTILDSEDCRLDMAWADESALARTPGLARLDEISRLVANDLERALALIAKPPLQ
jgi:type I restriction enzyme M protein